MSDVRSFYLLRMAHRREERRERGRTTVPVHPRARSADQPTEIADCDNVAENKLGHDGGGGGQEREEQRTSSADFRFGMREEFAENGECSRHVLHG